MSRPWPPKSHKFPIVFKSGDNVTGLSKMFSAKRTENMEKMMGKKGKSFFKTKHCFEFDNSYYFPNNIIASDEKVNNIVIMLNGFNEIHNYHMAHYDRIGTDLARKGIGAILHPTPFHLNRSAYLRHKDRNKYEKKKNRRQKWPKAPGTNDMKRHPSNSLYRHPESIFYCFDQVIGELNDLVLLLKNGKNSQEQDCEHFFKYHIDSNVKINLLGYSLGGLQALYAFLSHPNLFGQCVLINSGVSIDQLKTKPVGISDNDWEILVNKIKKKFDEISNKLPSAELLKEVLFGFDHRQKAFETEADRVLFISGGADKVAENRHLEKLPGTEGLNVIQLHGLQHPLQSPVFDRWFPVISDAIHSFVSAPRSRIISAKEVVDELLDFQIEGKRWDKFIRKEGTVQESPYVESNNLLIEDIYTRISGDINKFHKLIMMSKRYYKNDAELLRAIERKSLANTARDERNRTKRQ